MVVYKNKTKDADNQIFSVFLRPKIYGYATYLNDTPPEYIASQELESVIRV